MNWFRRLAQGLIPPLPPEPEFDDMTGQPGPPAPKVIPKDRKKKGKGQANLWRKNR